MFIDRIRQLTLLAAMGAAVVLCACAGPDTDPWAGGGGLASYQVIQRFEADILGRDLDSNNERSFTFSAAGPIKVRLSQPTTAASQRAASRLRLEEGDRYDETSTKSMPTLEWAAPESGGVANYTLTVINRATQRRLKAVVEVLGEATTPPPAGARLVDETRFHEVLFTNPICPGKSYAAPIPTVDGTEMLTAKPANVYCTSDDKGPSGARASSPQHQLIEWIKPLKQGDELFLAYLSFSDKYVHNELCTAAGKGVKIRFVYAGGSYLQSDLEACGDVKFLIRGKMGGVGHAHNKVFMVNPAAASSNDAGDDRKYQKIAFSSGNMSSGTVVHHENWQFMDIKRDSYFAAAHRCLYQIQLDEAGTPDDRYDDPASSHDAYVNAMDACLTAAKSQFAEEEDIKIFFIPNERHHYRLRKLVVEGIQAATELDLAAHRFGSAYNRNNGTPGDPTDDVAFSLGFIGDLSARLKDTNNPVSMRMVGDDDLYWMIPYGQEKPFGATPDGNNGWSCTPYDDQHKEQYTCRRDVVGELPETSSLWSCYEQSGEAVCRTTNSGANSINEAANTRRLFWAGGSGERFEIRYVETNHGEYRLHHNKWMIFRGMPGRPDAMLCGAANLTGTGFGDPNSRWDPNFENIYWITIPWVVEKYTTQMNRFWGVKAPGDTQEPPAATPPAKMPAYDE